MFELLIMTFVPEGFQISKYFYIDLNAQGMDHLSGFNVLQVRLSKSI